MKTIKLNFTWGYALRIILMVIDSHAKKSYFGSARDSAIKELQTMAKGADNYNIIINYLEDHQSELLNEIKKELKND
tara:strand:+ start:753 stop:983 length:231 start_codon:yes stop_codon:yes gene_type:complete